MWSATRAARLSVWVVSAAAALLLLTVGQAQAQQSKASYTVSYLPVADDCDGNGMNLSKGLVELSSSGTGKVAVRIVGSPEVPVLRGTRGKRAARVKSKFKAQASGPTERAAIRGKYSASGRVGKGKIQMVFIAEFYRGKKPLCTQSWSAQGSRK